MKFFSDLQFQKNFLKQNKSYLKKGVFVLHENLRTYILKEYKNGNWFPRAQHTLKNKIKNIIAYLLYSVKTLENGKDFNAQAIYFTNMPQEFNRDAKFFDYDAKVIRTVCPNKKRYDLYMKNRKYFEKYLPMVDLLGADENSLFYDEKMIDKSNVSYNEWETVFKKLFNVYIDYYKTSGIDKTDVTYDCKYISNTIDKNRTLLTTMYRQHGDLSSDNFIYDINGNMFFIDFDHANYYPAFYDLFFLMVNLYCCQGIDVGIKLLVNSAFDDYFNNACEIGINSLYDAFLLFSNYYMDVCHKEGLALEWQTKNKKILCGILERLMR